MQIADVTSNALLARIPAFKDYLREHGCEIQPLSNDYELVRFKSALGVGVIYTGKRGLSGNVPFVADALTLFLTGQPWESGKVRPTIRNSSPKRKAALLKRDGPNCWFCSKPLGSDITEEHLIPVTQRGSNHLDNIVLAHTDCNGLASHKSLVEKILLRDQLRNPKESPTYA